MRLKYIVILVLSLIAVTFFLGRISTFGERKSKDQTILALTGDISTYKTTISGLKVTVSEKSTVILQKDAAIEAGLVEQDRLKQLNFKRASHIVKVEGYLADARDSIPTYTPPTGDTLIQTENITPGEGKNYMAIPTEFYVETTWLNLTCGIDENKLGYYDVNFPVALEVLIGDKNVGLWKTTPTVAVTTTNPHLVIESITPIDLRGSKKWYQKPLVVGGIGLGVGLVTGLIIAY